MEVVFTPWQAFIPYTEGKHWSNCWTDRWIVLFKVCSAIRTMDVAQEVEQFRKEENWERLLLQKSRLFNWIDNDWLRGRFIFWKEWHGEISISRLPRARSSESLQSARDELKKLDRIGFRFRNCLHWATKKG